MIRLNIILFALLFACSCSAQLSKFEGTWVHKGEKTPAWNPNTNESWEVSSITTFRIQIIDDKAYVRGKEERKSFGRPEHVSPDSEIQYLDIRDVTINNDSSISCKLYMDSSMKYFDKNGNNREKNPPSDYQSRMIYETITFRRSRPWLNVLYGNVCVEYYTNGVLIHNEDFLVLDEPKIFYNEKDNW